MRPPQGREGSDTSLRRCLAWFAGEAIEERLEEALSAKGILIWPHLWQQETESEIEGGVFAPPRERKVLFSKKLKFRVADLPHREHRVTITARMLDVEEEEDG